MSPQLTGSLVAAAIVIAALAWRLGFESDRHDSAASSLPPESAPPVDEAVLRKLCSHCHRFPDPQVLPQSSWGRVIRSMSALRGYGNGLTPPPVAQIVAWYEERAPDALRVDDAELVPDLSPGAWQATPLAKLARFSDPYTSNVGFHDVFGDDRAELYFADMRHGRVAVCELFDGLSGRESLVGTVPHPAHVTPVDFDQDGRCDFLVANLGSFSAIDHSLGSVEWFRQGPDGSFEQFTLCSSLGRVADVRCGDLDSDGDLDLVVAEFGWRATGRTILFENDGPQASPAFRRHDLDGRSGPIHVPLVDLDGDGRLDIVVLLGQEHEAVIAFLNQGEFRFSMHELFRAPHPAWGATGIEPVDLDGDDDVDFVITNGDTFDDGLLRPDHGVTWLENRGGVNFEAHKLARIPAAHRAIAADPDDDGDLDLFVCTMAGETATKAEATRNLPSLVFLEQRAGREFVPVAIERGASFHPTMAVTIDQGRLMIATGNAYLNVLPGQATTSPVTIWSAPGTYPSRRGLP